MMKISEAIKNTSEMILLGVILAKIHVKSSPNALKHLLLDQVTWIENYYTIDHYRTETLEASRRLYKKLGKDPSRYRLSSDSLMRRIINKKGIYFVNNIVDINNLISLKTLWSVGAYDVDKIQGEMAYVVGGDEFYEGIGRGVININKLPVLSDDLGPFGSATSDTIRTMVTEDTKEVLMVIHGFGDGYRIVDALDELESYLIEYAEAEIIKKMIVE